MEVQSFFSPLFVALLCQVSFLVVEGCAEAMQDQQHVTNWVDPVRCPCCPGALSMSHSKAAAGSLSTLSEQKRG